MQYGRVIAIAAVALGVFILLQSIFSMATRKPDTPNSYSYHLGCYENNRDFNQTHRIRQYLINISRQMAPFSAAEVRKRQQYADQGVVNPGGANRIALEFKKYIVAYQNLKNLNEYEQTYNKGIREAREDFLQCRQNFQSTEWDCKGTYERYLNSDGQFSIIKSSLSEIISKKYEQQKMIEDLLEPSINNQTADNETYHKLMEKLNNQLSQLWDAVKQKNETLIGIENKQFRMSHDLISMKQQLQDCEKNKKQIEICKSIGERLQDLIHVVDAQELQARITAKQAIIERYESALAKSMKVGLDTKQIREKLAKNQRELNDLLEMYHEVETASLCAGDLIKKCSDEQIKELEANITSLDIQLGTMKQLKIAIVNSIKSARARIDEIVENKRVATEDYQNSLGSIEKIKELQATNLEKLKSFRDNIQKYNGAITSMQGNVTEAEQKRRKTIHDLDNILGRVGELTSCLAKKDYLMKLQSKRPQLNEEDMKVKREAAETLIKMVRSVHS